jgi:hypothetical protein
LDSTTNHTNHTKKPKSLTTKLFEPTRQKQGNARVPGLALPNQTPWQASLPTRLFLNRPTAPRLALLLPKTDTKTTPKPHSRAIFCRAGDPPAIEQFTPAGGTPALHFKSPLRASAGDASDRTFSTTSTGKPNVIVIILRFLIAEKTQRFFFIHLP